jgi:hypothetical protein
MRKLLGWMVFLAATWMLVSPQALIGLKELAWMHKYAFSGEVLLAIPVMAIAYYLLDLKPRMSRGR